jgi:protein tyrosine phosphatase (PTP) superfamily phosphohydrolase (DUF442 family)
VAPVAPAEPTPFSTPVPPAGVAPVPPAPAETRRYSPPAAGNTWRPPADARLAVPEPFSPEPPLAPGARLGAPESAGSQTQPRIPPRATQEPPATPSLPVGIPQFAVAQEGVASGLKPLLDGLDWLRANGYRTVLHIRQPGEDDTVDRRQIEKLGLKYLSLEVSPQTLSKNIVNEFNRLVADSASHPLFVYDQDGTLAGGLWYLHFRIAGQESDEVARLKAARLGLREEATGKHRAMWLAIQKYLSGQ